MTKNPVLAEDSVYGERTGFSLLPLFLSLAHACSHTRTHTFLQFLSWWHIPLLACAGAMVLFRKAIVSNALFPLAYQLYTKSPLGLWLHRRQLSVASGLPPHSTPDRDHVFDSFTVLTVPFLSDNYVRILCE